MDTVGQRRRIRKIATVGREADAGTDCKNEGLPMEAGDE